MNVNGTEYVQSTALKSLCSDPIKPCRHGGSRRSTLTLQFLLLVAATFGLVSCASWTYEADGPRHIPLDFSAICPLSGDPSVEEFALAKKAGAAWVRQGFFWDSIEPWPGWSNLEVYDRYVERAHAAGLKVLAVLDYDARWINLPGTKGPLIRGTQALSWYADHVRELVAHFKGKVDAWELWNEPNSSTFWRGSKQEFVKMHKLGVASIREVDPDAYIVGGGFSLVPEDWIDTCFRGGAFDGVDAISFHPYWMEAEGVLHLVDRMKAIVKAHGFKGALWVTEVGFPTAGVYPFASDEAGQAALLVKTWVGMALREVRAVFWYVQSDTRSASERFDPLDSESFFGVIRADGTPKPSLYAMAAVLQAIAGAQYDPGLVDIDPRLFNDVVALPFLHDNGSLRLLVWSRGGDERALSLAWPGSVTETDIQTGKTTALLHAGRLTLNTNPRILTLAAAVGAAKNARVVLTLPAD